MEIIQNFKNRFFDIEPIAKNLSFSHFLLSFGYKLFSLYFPLFLVFKGLSFQQVGYTYLLIYLPIALFAPISAFLCSRFNSFILIILGAAGYFFYSVAMTLNVNLFAFYLFQIILGISASLFFVGSRNLLVCLAKKPDKSFGWFYSVPTYADVLGPVVGAVLIWKFGFFGVFVFSFLIHFLNIIYSYKYLKNFNVSKQSEIEDFSKIKSDYFSIFRKLAEKKILIMVILVFLVMFLTGFYRAFFILFVKNILNWQQDKILLFVSLNSLIFIPVSWWIIKIIGKQKSRTNILQGTFIKGLMTLILGLGFRFFDFTSLMALEIIKGSGALMIGSGKSGFFVKKFKRFSQEISAIDTFITTFSVSIGSLLGGFLLKYFHFSTIFQWFGFALIILTLFIIFIDKRAENSEAT
ncbi:MAG: MFS transporter [bacterium]|nr:MFS transporter [bacterium]